MKISFMYNTVYMYVFRNYIKFSYLICFDKEPIAGNYIKKIVKIFEWVKEYRKK